MELEFYKRLFVVIIGFLQPIIILIVLGNIHSISSVWGTCLEPLFIFVNALTSYYFFANHKWQISSFLLLMLTSFSVVGFNYFHNILAISFFVSCLYPLYGIKRLRFYIWFYICSIPIGFSYGLFWAEVVGVYVICFYHVHLLYYLKKNG
jgi:hypothetical protein